MRYDGRWNRPGRAGIGRITLKWNADFAQDEAQQEEEEEEEEAEKKKHRWNMAAALHVC